MRALFFFAAGGLVGALATAGPVQGGPHQGSAARAAAGTESQDVLKQYCQGCHNERSAVGRDTGLMLDRLDPGRVGANAEHWERVVRRLRNGSMPPMGRPRPNPESYDLVASRLEGELDAAAAARPNPGRPATLHRLNRAEYRNAVRDILALDVDMSSLLPPDTASYGFDNIGDVLGVSPLLLESYLSAASKISRLAVASSADVAVTAETCKVSTELTQSDRIDGLPFGTRGGTRVQHLFPVDGEYEIRVRLARGGLTGNNYGIVGLREPHPLEITLDGERMQLLTAGKGLSAAGPETRREQSNRYTLTDHELFVRVPVKAGPRTVGAAFIKRPSVQVERVRRPFLRAMLEHGESHDLPYIGELIVTGPFDPKPPERSPSRDRIFVCRPGDTTTERACAEQIIATLARRAFRRPVTDADLGRLFPFFEQGREAGGFDAGIERALIRLLVSPSFLFRMEPDPDGVSPGTAYELDGLTLASRLSFFLWSTVPDDELLDLAEQGELDDPAVLEQQVQRMLADRRSDALVSNFAGQWLYLRNVSAAKPDFRLFPDVDDNLRHAFRRETELLFESIIREDRSVLDLLTADYTFVNERLARHYGIPHVYGDHFRRVSTAEHPERGGLLGQGSFLTVQSTSTRTSPVKRGIWILENILGTVPPDPPADVPALDAKRFDGRVLSMREAMEAHRANPTCAACHQLMDPLGLSLENFDAVGRWRDVSEANAPIDASGALPNGTPFSGAVGLKQVLLAHKNQVVQTITEKLLTYALGRGLDYYDAPAIRRIIRGAEAQDHRFSTLVFGIVKSVPFTQRMAGGDGAEQLVRAAQN